MTQFFPRALISFVIVLLGLCTTTQARTIIDMRGREVVIPDKIDKVFSASYPLTVLLYALAPDLLAATNFPISEPAKPFLDPSLRTLPVLGGMPGRGRSLNPEEVMALHPDVILAWIDPMGDTDRTLRQFSGTGLPVLFVEMNTLAGYPSALRFLGTLLHREERAEKLAAYIEAALTHVKDAVGSLPADKKIRIYYAESPDGLATECDTSFHIEPVILAGGEAVHHCEQTTHMGMDRVTLEQIIAERPDVLLVQDPDFGRTVAADPNWRHVEAVQREHITIVPHFPFNWLDRPPSVMRALGIQWLANSLYPDRFPFDRIADTRTFLRLFFGSDPSDKEIEQLLH